MVTRERAAATAMMWSSPYGCGGSCILPLYGKRWRSVPTQELHTALCRLVQVVNGGAGRWGPFYAYSSMSEEPDESSSSSWSMPY